MGASSAGVVIGIGNALRGDDAVGRVVARLLRDRGPCGLEIAEQHGEAADLLEALRGTSAAYVVDAAKPHSRPGVIHRFDIVGQALPHTFNDLSTHGLGVAAAFELARALHCLPQCCVVYAIEGRSFAPGAPLSPEVAEAAEEVVSLIMDEVG